MDNNIYKRGRLHSIIKLLFATVATMLFALSFNMTGGGATENSSR
ncbi:hypothetical protein LRA02_25300 [Lentilactobacillus rapi]|uniref:Uncharacterized protein n=1 Tax=Lentilactobacillus rapi TaxID=481723 RepID=A0A512PRA5_9LACO|nr:hypothetical protein [Lentilactobacillus rapi]GEP73662.1 hypothetical protein LRA02_25300 [Lentilactobacillus rapi]